MLGFLCFCPTLNNNGIKKTVKENNSYLFPFQDLKNKKWGYMDVNGNRIILPTLDYAKEFSDGYAVVGMRSRYGFDYGYINLNGDVVIPIKYDRAFPVSDGLFCVLKKKVRNVTHGGERWLYFDKDKNKVLELKNYYRAAPFSDGLAVVAKDDQMILGAIDISNNYIIMPQYNYLGAFSDGLMRFSNGFGKERKYGFVNKANDIVIPERYELAGNYSEGFAPVMRNEKWGYIDKKNNTVIPYQFDHANSFSENVATVEANGLWGVIGHDGEYIISPQYSYLLSCYNGLIMVCDENKNFLSYINLKGEIIKPKE